MKIIFLRHAKSEVNPLVSITMWGLSEEGMKLANSLSKNKLIKSLDIIYSSNQKKAIETANILAKATKIPTKIDNNLTEVTSFTNFYEPNFSTYENHVKDYYSGIINRIHKGETKKEALDRFMKALLSIVEHEKKSVIGIVTHGHILSLFAAEFSNVDSYAIHTKIKQPDIAVFDWDKKKFISFFKGVK